MRFSLYQFRTRYRPSLSLFEEPKAHKAGRFIVLLNTHPGLYSEKKLRGLTGNPFDLKIFHAGKPLSEIFFRTTLSRQRILYGQINFRSKYGECAIEFIFTRVVLFITFKE